MATAVRHARDEAAARYPNLVEDIENAPKVRIADGKYTFRAFSFGEKGTLMKAELGREIDKGLFEKVRAAKAEFGYIVSPEPAGHVWALSLAGRLKVSLCVAARSLESLERIALINSAFAQAHGKRERKKRQYVDFVPQKSGYGESTLHVPRPKKGDRVIIVDDVVSSGGTASALADYLEAAGAKVVAIFCIVTKGDGHKELEKRGIPVRSLLKLTKSGEVAGLGD